jgi:triosephosphate isomerase (TIM)
MRKRIVAGNWKMNLSLEEARNLAAEVCTMISKDVNSVEENKPEVVFFPPFVYITDVVKLTNTTPGVSTGAQNCHQEANGAFTGEVSAAMIASCGATHTLVGHSERRSYFEEDDALLSAKTKAALANGLVPVFCCGEQLPEREAGKHFETVKTQLQDGLFGLEENDFRKVVIAYEPVWAIGTGKTATPDQAQEMHAFIRGLIREQFGNEVAENTTILYGGSCNAGNAAELFRNPDVDGGLIGGASLKAADFFTIIKSFE